MRLIFTILLFCSINDLCAQSMGIGTLTPNPSAALEVFSTKKGFLTPRLSTIQRDSVSNPTIGLLIFNTSESKFEYFDSSHRWVSLVNNRSTSAINDTSKKIAVVYGNGIAYGFYFNTNGVGTWTTQSIGSSNNFATTNSHMIIVFNNTKAYGFNQTPGMNAEWTVGPSYSTTNAIIAGAAVGNFLVVYAGNSVHVFYRKSNVATGFWSSQAVSGTVTILDEMGSDLLVVTSNQSYVFYQDSNENGVWAGIPVTLTGTTGTAISK